ncbi:hypothetical protein LTR51_001189 [Lithohypha guttulata]|nr:hypothetical protein LTR51_001189 [Lithohypha guttulata]
MANTSAVLQHLGVLDSGVDFAAAFATAQHKLSQQRLPKFHFDTTYNDFTSHVSSLTGLPASSFPQRDEAREALIQILQTLRQITRGAGTAGVDVLTECVGNLINALPNPDPLAQQVYTSTVQTQSTPALSNTVDQEQPGPSQPSLPHYFSNPPRSDTADSIAADEPSNNRRPSRPSIQDIPLGHRTGRVVTEDRAALQQGHIIGTDALRMFASGTPVPVTSSNDYGNVHAKGDSRVLIGNQYGGPGFFDRSNSAPVDREHEPQVNWLKRQFTAGKKVVRG